MQNAPNTFFLPLKGPLKSLYLLLGNDETQKQGAKHEIIQAALDQGYQTRFTFELSQASDWRDLYTELQSHPLFSSLRLFICLIKPGRLEKETGAILNAILKTVLSTIGRNLLVFILDSDALSLKKYPLLKPLELQAVTFCLRKLTPLAFLAWLKKQATLQGLTLDQDGLFLLAEYSEGNLTHAQNLLERLQFVDSGCVTVEIIKAVANKDARFSIFELVDALYAGKVQRVKSILWSLKGENGEPVLALWAITRELRLWISYALKLQGGLAWGDLVKKQFIRQAHLPHLKHLLSRLSVPKLYRLLIQAKAVDDIIKARTQGKPWEALYSLCLGIVYPETLDVAAGSSFT